MEKAEARAAAQDRHRAAIRVRPRTETRGRHRAAIPMAIRVQPRAAVQAVIPPSGSAGENAGETSKGSSEQPTGGDSGCAAGACPSLSIISRRMRLTLICKSKQPFSRIYSANSVIMSFRIIVQSKENFRIMVFDCPQRSKFSLKCLFVTHR